MNSLTRRATFLVLIAVIAAALAYAFFGRARPGSDAPPGRAAAPRSAIPLEKQQLLFRSTALGPAYGRLAVTPLSAADGPAMDLALTCDRVHFAGGRGICLTAERGVVTTYSAVLFDDRFAARHTLQLDGAPNRTRVSPDGRRGAVTLFAKAEAYEGAAVLTRTLIIDMTAGTTIGELERFPVLREGTPAGPGTLGFRGVTFAADGNRFFATLRTREGPRLVEGDVDARTAHVIRDDVECPSLSPDERRIAFLRHIPEAQAIARLHVLDLDTGQVTALAETRSVDDQVEWLDNERVAYALPAGAGSSAIWSVPADGSGEPVRLRGNAFSPAVVR
jgi:hypothetical protein